MKKFKYLLMIFVLFNICLNLYDNYIYFLVPHNPLQSITDIPYNFHFKSDNLNVESFSVNDSKIIISKFSDNSENNSIIFEYFKNLNLVPLKERPKSQETFENKSNVQLRYNFMFKSESSKQYYININEINLDDLSSFYISSDLPRLKTGYYQIVNSEFDYILINEYMNSF